MTGNPYVDEVEPSNPYLEPEESTPPEPPTLNPLQQAQWEQLQRGPLQPMGTLGPIQPPEEALAGPNIFTGLAALGKGAQAVAEPVFTAAEDIVSEGLRSYGIPAYPGKPLVETGPYPITAASSPGWLLRKYKPEIAAAIDETAGNILTGFTTPGNVGLIAAPIAKPALAKPLQGLFMAGVGGSIPESVQNVMEAPTAPERTKAATQLGSEIAMAYFLGKHMGQGRTVRERIQDARRQSEAAKVYGDVRPQPGEGEGKMPAQISGEGVQPSAEGLAQETRVPLISESTQELIDSGMLNNRSLGLGHEIEVVTKLEGDPRGLAPFESQPAVVDASGEFVRPGIIRINAPALASWMEDMKGKSPEQVRKAFLSLFAEEGIHSITTPAEAAAFAETLTPMERAIGRRQYLGDINPEDVGFNDAKLGYELLRQRMQRLLNMEPTEIAELAKLEGWGTKGLEMISRIIRRIREFIGTKAAKSGLRITNEMLDRAEGNISAAEKLTAEQMATVDAPFGLRRRSPEGIDDTIERLRTANMRTFNDEVTSNEKGLTGEAWDLGYSVHTPDQLDSLMKGYQDAGLNFRAAMDQKDLKTAGFEAMRGQFFREAYEAATGTGSAGRSLSQELGAEYQPPFPKMGVQGIRRGPREGKEALAERLVYMGKANTMTEAVRMLDNDRDIKQLAETMVYKGEARTVTDAVTDIEQGNAPHYVYQALYDWSKPGAQGIRRKPGKGEMELPLFVPPKGVEKETFEKGVRIEAKDHPEIAAKQPELLQQLAKDELKLDPNAYAKDKDPGELQLSKAATPAERVGTGFDFEARRKEELAKTAVGIERKVGDFIRESDQPSFRGFVKSIEGAQPGHMRELWRQNVFKNLDQLSGKEVEKLRDQLDLRRQVGSGQIADPLPPIQEPGAQHLPIPGITRPHFTLPKSAEAKYGPYDVGFKPKQRGGPERMSPAQQYRNKVLAKIGEKLIAQADDPGKASWKKTEITPEDIGYWRENSSKEPAVRQVRAEERSNPEKLGELLTRDASVERSTFRKKVVDGKVVEVKKAPPPESVTKRLVAMVDKKTGEVQLVSVYRKGRGGAYAVNPKLTHLQRPNVPLGTLLDRYDPIYSVLLDEPVQNFHQKFGSVREFTTKFLKPADERSRSIASSERSLEEQSEGEHADLSPSTTTTGKVAKPGTMMNEPGTLESAEEITPTESHALLYTIYDEIPGELESSADILSVMDALRVKADQGWLEARDYAAISALRKGFDALKAKWGDALTDDLVLAQLIDEVYEHSRKTTDAEDYHARLAESYGNKAAESIRQAEARRLGEARSKQQAQSGARELGIKRTHGPTWTPDIPKGPGPEPTLPVPKDPAMLSPEELAYVRSLTGTTGEKLTPEQQGILGIRRLAKGAGDMVDQTALEFLRWYSEWMVDKLERIGGPYSRVLAKSINAIISREREIYGTITPQLDSARKLAGQPGRATTWLHGLKNVTPRAAVANTVNAVENRIGVPAFAQRLVNALQVANLEIGRLLMGSHATGKFQRNLTAEGVDIIRQGSGPAWDALVEGNAVLNRVPVSDVANFFRDMKQQLDRPDITQAEIEKVNQDFERVMPKAVTHVKLNRPFPRWIPVLHADAFNYLENAARRASHVKAFREKFPNTPQGIKDFNQLMTLVRDEMPGEYYIDNLTALMRALQGHPTDTYKANPLTGVGSYGREALQFVNQTLGGLFSKLVLTGQMVTQLPETVVGATPMMLGFRNYLRGMAKLRQLYPELEKNGAVNRVILDYSFDPHSAIRSSFRIAGNTISKVFAEHLLNELQEGSAAATARIVSERIRSGNLSAWEKSMLPETFKAMGFSPAEARSMMLGNAGLLQQFERKAASFLTSGNKAIAEGSKLGANRFANTIFRFQSYPMMKMNQLRKATKNMVDAWNSGTPSEKAASTYLLSRFLFGLGAQGALTVGLSALAMEGMGGARIKWHEATDEPLQFITESMLSSLSGPVYMLWRGARSQNSITGVADRAMKSIFPLSIMAELYNYAYGLTPQYKDRSVWDKTVAFVKSKAPGTKIIGSGLAAVGLSSENKELDAAISAFYRYSRDNWGTMGQGPMMKDDERKEFRTALRQAIEAMKRGDSAGFDKAMDKVSYYAPNAKSMDQSLRSRALFKKPDGKEITDEEEQALRKHIGDRAVDLLQDWDTLVESLAPKKKLSRRRAQ